MAGIQLNLTQEITRLSNASKRQYRKDVLPQAAKALRRIDIETYVYDRSNLRMIYETRAEAPSGVLASSTITTQWSEGFIAHPLTGQVFGHFDRHAVEDSPLVADTYSWLLRDHAGTVRDVVSWDGSDLLHEYVTYGPFGEVESHVQQYGSFSSLTGSIATDPTETYDHYFAFHGQFWDVETGLQYHNARYFDASTNRFISQDPLGFGGGDTNLYQYAYNNPNTFTDPSGEAVVMIAMAGLALGSVALAYAGAHYAEEGAKSGDNELYQQGVDMFGWGVFGAFTAASFMTGGLIGMGARTLALEGGLMLGAESGLRSYASGNDASQVVFDTGMGVLGGAAMGYGFGKIFGGLSRAAGSTADCGLTCTTAGDKLVSIGAGAGRQPFNYVKENGRLIRVECFAAGTPILTPDGFKQIEDFQPGDLVLARQDDDPNAPVEAKVVHRVFSGAGELVAVVVNGYRIRTTRLHPFWVQGQGWVPAAKLEVGMRLSSADGQWVCVEALEDEGEYETVYNLRVCDYQTYFVGEPDWGFSVWAHNTYGAEDRFFKAVQFPNRIFDDQGRAVHQQFFNEWTTGPSRNLVLQV